MEQNSVNLAKGIVTGCLIAFLMISLATKAKADEIIKSPVEHVLDLASKSTVPGIYFGSRGSRSEHEDIWAL